MSIYNLNGIELSQLYDLTGINKNQCYDIIGNELLLGVGYYENLFYEFVDDYIDEHGLIIDGQAVTKEEMTYYLLNRDNCLYRGKLAKSGQHLIDSHGNPFELRGIGTHALTQYTNLHTRESLRALKYFGINCIRLSAYLLNHAFTYSDGLTAQGYIPFPASLKEEMDRIIGYCEELGLYAIVDWHVWSGGGETLSTSDAEGFFEYFANKYSDCDNVLYELANEPFSDTLSNIVAHYKTLRTLIKTYVNNPILIGGTRKSSGGASELYNALLSENIDDIFISQHRYSGQGQVSAFETDWNNGIPLFITEWSNTSSSIGQQSEMNITEGNAFLSFFHTNKIPNCIWKYTDQTMAYSAITNRGTINSSYYRSGIYLSGDISTYGHFFFDKFSAYAFSEHS